MAIVEKIRLKGFKSFPKMIEVPFGNGFSCVLGPNGSGKSNLADAICFVLGKSSAKSMRAEKSANLIYNGGKKGSPSKEAQVDIYFDNANKDFSLDEKQIKISRMVRNNGQSVYKINDKTRNRQEIIDLLNSARIDPDGHNVILQGDIVRFMEMKPINRRELVEEIAGISVYEDKKEKALRELEKVGEKLREVEIILTEREANLRELKKDRDQAKKFKEVESKIKDNKATFLHVMLRKKEERKTKIEKIIREKESRLRKIEEEINDVRKDMDRKREEINAINVELEEKGEREQINLREEITNLKTDSVKNQSRKETLQNELKKIEERGKQLRENIEETEDKIKELKKKRKNLETELNVLRKNVGNVGTVSRDDFERKLNELSNLKAQQSNFTIFEDVAVNKVLDINGVYGTVASLGQPKVGYTLPLEVSAGARNRAVVVKDDAVAEKCIKTLREGKLGVLTFLPLNKLRDFSISKDSKEMSKIPGVKGLAIDLIKFENKFKKVFGYACGSTLVVDDVKVARRIGIGRSRMVTMDGDLIETSGAMVGGFRKIKANKSGLNKRIRELEKEVEELKQKIMDPKTEKVKERIFSIKSEIMTVDNNIDMLMNENERIKNILREQEKEREDFRLELKELLDLGKKKEKSLKIKEKDEQKFHGRLKSLVSKRNKLQELIQNLENGIMNDNQKIRKIEQEVNEVSITRAKVVAEMEGLEREFEEFKDGKIRRNVDFYVLKKEIAEFESIIRRIGNVNLRALEVYEDLKKEHDNLLKKADKLKGEKEDVISVINEIEEKKTGVFMEVFKKLSVNFRAIFSSLSTKGEALLELENKDVPLEGGLDIRVRVRGNKFLDIRGLSGGEKTLAALAFIFAIQDFDPAPFYLLDEVDAALDKHNSEKLSQLIKKYSNKAQYIVISHNDSVISEADKIFGVSMQDGVSKISSLRL